MPARNQVEPSWLSRQSVPPSSSTSHSSWKKGRSSHHSPDARHGPALATMLPARRSERRCTGRPAMSVTLAGCGGRSRQRASTGPLTLPSPPRGEGSPAPLPSRGGRELARRNGASRMASGRWLSRSTGMPTRSGPTSAASRARGSGSDTDHGPLRRPRLERRSEQVNDDAGIRRGDRGNEPPVVGCPIVEPAGPLEGIRRQPLALEAGTYPPGEIGQERDEGLEGVHRPLALDTLLEHAGRRPGTQRAWILSAGERLEPRAVGAEPLEERRGRKPGQIAQCPGPPAVEEPRH